MDFHIVPNYCKGEDNKNTKELAFVTTDWYVNISWNPFVERSMPRFPESSHIISRIDTPIHVLIAVYPIYKGPKSIKLPNYHKLKPNLHVNNTKEKLTSKM